MDEKFMKYRNLIALDNDYNLTESQFLELIQINIYVKSTYKWPKEDFYDLVQNNEILVSGTEILYDFYGYHLNEEIYNHISEQIYELLKKRFKYFYGKQKEEIKFELGKYITKEEKQNYLKKTHNEIWSSEFLNSIELKSEFLEFYNTDESELTSSEGWHETFWQKTENCHILRYLSTNDGIYECFKEFIDKWIEFGRIKHISIYCKDLMNQIEDSSIINQKLVSSLTPFQQVCFIEKSRELSINFKSFEYNKKLSYLNLITKGKNLDEKIQIETLEELIMMNDTDFSKLHDNYSEYARNLNLISGKSITNLRNAASTYINTHYSKNSEIIWTLESMEYLIKTVV